MLSHYLFLWLCNKLIQTSESYFSFFQERRSACVIYIYMYCIYIWHRKDLQSARNCTVFAGAVLVQNLANIRLRAHFRLSCRRINIEIYSGTFNTYNALYLSMFILALQIKLQAHKHRNIFRFGQSICMGERLQRVE